MLLFAEPSTAADDWSKSKQMTDEATGVVVFAAVAPGRHTVRLALGADHGAEGLSDAGETVGPIGAGEAGTSEHVSPVQLPPYYRWQDEGWAFEFQSWRRTAAPVVAVSLRHMAGLRSHPRAVVVEEETPVAQRLAGADAPIAALVVSAPKNMTGQSGGPVTIAIEWRGWHVVEVDEPFQGPETHVVTTHTRALRSPSSSGNE